MDNYDVYRVVTDMEALHDAFRDRVEDLQISRQTIDEIGSFTGGYSAKLLCDPPMKWIGKETLHKMLKATGMAIVLVVDDERFAAKKAELLIRKRTVRAVARIKRVKGHFTKENAAIFGKKRWANMTPIQRAKAARRSANARWKAVRRHRKMEKQRGQILAATQADQTGNQVSASDRA